MKVIGEIINVLQERNITTSNGSIRKKDFIISVKKPAGSTDEDRNPDTLALTLVGKHIDEYPIHVGDRKVCLYDCNARIPASGEGNEAFQRTNVFRMYDEDKEEAE